MYIIYVILLSLGPDIFGFGGIFSKMRQLTPKITLNTTRSTVPQIYVAKFSSFTPLCCTTRSVRFTSHFEISAPNDPNDLQHRKVEIPNHVLIVPPCLKFQFFSLYDQLFLRYKVAEKLKCTE